MWTVWIDSGSSWYNVEIKRRGNFFGGKMLLDTGEPYICKSGSHGSYTWSSSIDAKAYRSAIRALPSMVT